MNEFSYCYQITEEDVTGTFPYSKVLQKNYGTKNRHRQAYFEFKTSTDKYCMMFPDISLYTLQDVIVEEAKRVRRKYSECFPQVGWYDKIHLMNLAEEERRLTEVELEDLKKKLHYDTLQWKRYEKYWQNVKYHAYKQEKIWKQLHKAVIKGSKKRLTAINL